MTANPFESPENLPVASPPQRAWTGCLLSCIAIIAIPLLLVALLLPVLRRTPRAAAYRVQCQSHVKNIALALHNYHADHGALPPAYTVDDVGKPLHSWRTLILPYMDSGPLLRSIDLSKPWNDPVNSEALRRMPEIYSCPGTNVPAGYTTYLAVAGSGSCLDSTRPRSLSEITDGTRSTLMIVETPAEIAVPWMAPLDADADLLRSTFESGKMPHAGGTVVAMADGSVHFFPENIDSSALQSMITINGGEEVSEDF